MSSFCHLHCHTQYSLLDGAARINRLVTRAAELEMPAVAITDHGNLYGVPEFYAAARKQGVQPIIGCEFYLTPSGMADKTDRTRYHQLLLAANDTGYRNLIKLSSLSYSDGFYYKPRIDFETLTKFSSGLIATTCCLQGEVPQTLLNQGEEAGRKAFERYLTVFGENYYIEIQDHGISEQRQINPVLLRWAEEYGVTVLATNDVHYVEETDSEAHDVLLCLQTGKDLNDPKRMRFDNDQFFLKSSDEMISALSGIPSRIAHSSLENTLEVAEKCKFDLKMGDLLMPHFPIPEKFNNDADAYLRDLTFERARTRYPEMPQIVVERIDHELSIIRHMKYAGYFLIVQDFTTEARRLGVRVGPGRGSAAGSCVAYCLGITDIEPLQYDLLFERFLNPERVSMPDIDIDFDDRGRAKVIDYVIDKYGRNSVCQIITFGSMGARSVIRDVSRVLGVPLSEADRIAKLIPEGPSENLDSAREKVKEFAQLFESKDPTIRNLMRFSTVLEGSARHTGIHAAGIIIAPGDITDYIPVATTRNKGNTDDWTVTTQYDGKWVEEFGLLKMDFLGLKTLTIIEDCLELIKEKHNVDVDLENLTLDDPAVYHLFQKGETVAIFQFESSGMREYLRKLVPDTFNDLIAMNALYRPGPMDNIPEYIDRKHGRKEIRYPHQLLENILKPTYGIPVYQEQVMEIAREMGGYTLGGADLLRRAMGKKKQEEMDKHRITFIEGARKKGVTDQVANEVFDLMAKFAGYGFNKSHAAAYSLVAYQTAFLKVHYPREYMAAVMTAEMGDIKKLQVNLEEARRMNHAVLPPSVNLSGPRFSVEDSGIRFGLTAIKGVGQGAVEAIEAERTKNGPFTSLFDLCARADYRSVNKKTLESMGKVGAFDEFEGHRSQFVEALDLAIKYGQKTQNDKAAGQNSLFGASTEDGQQMAPALPYAEPWTTAVRLKNERELMGFYVSGHPLDEYQALIRALSTGTLANPEELDEEKPYVLAGLITSVRPTYTKTGREMAYAQFEDFYGGVELVIFSTQIEKMRPLLVPDAKVMVKGTVTTRGGSARVKVREMWSLADVQERCIESITVNINLDTEKVDTINQFHTLSEQNRGRCKLYFQVHSKDLEAPIRLRSRGYVLDPSPLVMRSLTSLFGIENVIITGNL